MAVITRLLAGQVPAAEIAAVRFVVGIVGVLGIFAARGQRPNLTQWRFLALRGLLGGVAVVTYFVAIERLGAAPATVLNYSSPIFAALFASWFLGETSTAVRKLGLVVATACAGLVTFSTSRGPGSFVPDVGAIIGLLSAVAGGGAMTVIRRLRDDTDAMTVFLAFCVVGLAVSAPLAAPGWVPLEGRALAICLAVGVLSIAGQLLFTWGMGHTSATAGSATTQLVPVVAWVLALGWLGEPITAMGVLGALLVVGGVLLGVIPWRDVLTPPTRAP